MQIEFTVLFTYGKHHGPGLLPDPGRLKSLADQGRFFRHDNLLQAELKIDITYWYGKVKRQY